MTGAQKREVVFVGLCQTQALGGIYAMHIAPFRDERVTYVKLHPWQHDAEAADALQKIKHADVVIEQVFDGPSRIPPTLLAKSVKRVLHPYLHIGFLWPYCTQPHPSNESFPWLEAGPYGYELGDDFLNRLIRDKVPPAEALRRYLDHDIVVARNFERLLEINLHMQRRREARTDIRIADHIERRFRNERLFFTKGHPTPVVMRLLVEQVFAALDVPSGMVERALQSPVGAPHFSNEMPYHPRLASDLGLTFVAPGERYRFLEEGRFTFDEYVMRYMEYRWEPELAEGIALVNQGQGARAVPLLESALQRRPDSRTGWYFLARQQRIFGDYASAHVSLDRAAALITHDPDVLTERALLLMAEARYDEAEKLAVAAIALAPLAQGANSVMADIHRARNLHRQAARAAVRAARLAPGDSYVVSKAGKYLLDIGRSVAAERALRRAIELNAANHDARRTLIALLRRTGRQEDALRLLEAGNGSDAVVRFDLGVLLRNTGDLRGAEDALRRAIELEPGLPGAANILAGVLMQAGRQQEAIDLLRPLAADSEDAHLHHRLGLLYCEAGDLAAAETALRRSVGLDGRLHGALTTLAGMLERSDRLEEAFGLLQPAALDSADAMLHFTLGTLRRRLGDLDGAEHSLRRAIALEPGLPGAVNILAGVLMEEGDDAEAMALLQPLAADSQDAHLHHRLGILLFRAGDLNGAETALRRSIALDGALHGAVNTLAGVLERSGRAAEAVAILRPVVAAGLGDAHLHHRLGYLLARMASTKSNDTSEALLCET
jgi:Flp pilus assembly protein TadD